MQTENDVLECVVLTPAGIWNQEPGLASPLEWLPGHTATHWS